MEHDRRWEERKLIGKRRGIQVEGLPGKGSQGEFVMEEALGYRKVRNM